jgi:hypothetical protein
MQMLQVLDFTSKLFYFIQQPIMSNIFLFNKSNVFGSRIIHILYTGCDKKKKKNNSGAKSSIFILEDSELEC